MERSSREAATNGGRGCSHNEMTAMRRAHKHSIVDPLKAGGNSRCRFRVGLVDWETEDDEVEHCGLQEHPEAHADDASLPKLRPRCRD
jgi:hypothetical protein